MFGFLRRTAPEQKASRGEVIFGDAFESTMTGLEAFAKEGYAGNVTVFRCVDLISTCAASIKLQVKVGDELAQESHPFQMLLNRPNPDQGGVEFRTESFGWQVLMGNSYTERMVGRLTGTPTQLWNWQPYRMSIERRKGDPMPARYVFGKNTDQMQAWDVDPVSGDCDMLHWRTFNPSPEARGRGQSPLAPGGCAADSYNLATKWRAKNMQNGGSPKHLVSFEDGSALNTKEVEKALEQKFTGADGKRWMVAAGGKMTITPLESSMRDAEWLGGTKLNKQELCEVFGVPSQLLGIEGSQTFANYAEARQALYQDRVLPLVELYISELNRWLAPLYGEGVKVCYDRDSIEALEPSRSARRQEIMASDAFSINEKREMFGYEAKPDPEADSLFVDPSKLPLGMDVMDLKTEEVTKALQRTGYPRDEAEMKALDIMNERTKWLN